MESSQSASIRVLVRPTSSTVISENLSVSSSSSSSSSSYSSSNVANPNRLPKCNHSSSSSSSSSSSTSCPLSSSSSSSSTTQLVNKEGSVVVVGFIGKSSNDITPIINRILDANIFGSGRIDNSLHHYFRNSKLEWFRHGNISYYHEKENGLVFLQFSSSPSEDGFETLMHRFNGGEECLQSFMERESGDLLGMLLMFSVCHIIIFLHEGSHFDIHVLKKFRMLQAAKHILDPLVKSKMTPIRSPEIAVPSKQNIQPISPIKLPPDRGANVGIQPLSIPVTSLSPHQSTPVILFVFVDDFLNDFTSGCNPDDSSEISGNPSSSTGEIPRSVISTKGSGSFVMLARTMNKIEGSPRKKLQSFLETQVRFLIKKCRTLAGSESTHSGSRNGSQSSLPLFSIDASRVVALLDSSMNLRGESIDYVTDLLEQIFNSKASSDILTQENRHRISCKEDVQSIKDFIFRQSETLRGRGALSTNNAATSSAGVGMAAVVVAAAAASAASSKPFVTPTELPTLEKWLSFTLMILDLLLSVKYKSVVDNESFQRTQYSIMESLEGSDLIQSKRDAILSCFENAMSRNMKFSISWCQRSCPAAKMVYLKDLPVFYSTSVHKTHLRKALDVFYSLVKGPAVEMFAEKLKDECTSIWESGRQLCDAVSLSGKPCIHQRHSLVSDLTSKDAKPHFSGFVFLHACACGRSRGLRDDPFDFETANINFSSLSCCDKLLSSLKLPMAQDLKVFRASSWSLIRLGCTRYYEPSKGLLQSGFICMENFLSKFTPCLEKQKAASNPPNPSKQLTFNSSVKSKSDLLLDNVSKETSKVPTSTGEANYSVECNTQSENLVSADPKISFGKGFPQLIMKRPFSEVVAGLPSTTSTSHILPPENQSKVGRGNNAGENDQTNCIEGGVSASSDIPSLHRSDDDPEIHKSSSSHVDQESLPKAGGDLGFPNIDNNRRDFGLSSSEHSVIYIGFEHECPRGHRFLLSPERIKDLGSSYPLVEESSTVCSVYSGNSNSKILEPSNKTKDQSLSGMVPSTVNKLRVPNKSGVNALGIRQFEKSIISDDVKQQYHSFVVIEESLKSLNILDENLHYLTIDDEGRAFDLLNRNLPIYMNCPHCMEDKNKMEHPKVQYAGMISQLQRIFLVTPPFPIVLSTCPTVQFQDRCIPSTVAYMKQQLQFNLGSQVILPPESFLTLRLPFIYAVQLENGTLYALKPLENRPELTAWITKGTTLQILST